MKVGGASLLLLHEGRAEQNKPGALSFDCLLYRRTWAKHANAKPAIRLQCEHCAQAAIEGPAFRTHKSTDSTELPMIGNTGCSIPRVKALVDCKALTESPPCNNAAFIQSTQTRPPSDAL